MNFSNIKAKLIGFGSRIKSSLRFRSDKHKDLTRLELVEMWLSSFIWASIFVVLFCVVSFMGWWIFSRSHPKIFTGVNYYRAPIRVQIEDSVYNLAQFETFVHETESIGTISIEVKDSSGRVIDSRTHSTTNLAGVGLDFFAPEGGTPICIVELDVTELFYPVAGKNNREAYLVTQLTEQDGRSYYYQYSVLSEKPTLLSLHNYSGNHLPAEISTDQTISGLYAIECDSIGSVEAITEEAIWWTFYDPAEQQKLYQEQIEEINNTPEYQL